MELHQLRYFVAVAEEGGFCRAASRLGIAQPSLSQQVRKLEGALGRALFDRLGRRTVLTDAGRALLPRAKGVLAEVREMEAGGGAGDLGSTGGTLTIGAIPTIAPYALPRAIKGLLREHPDVEVVIREDVTDRLVPMLSDAELDVCILSTPVEHPMIELEMVGSESLWVAVPKDHPWAKRRSVPLSDLDHEGLIVLHEEHCFGRQLAALCSSAKVCPTVRSVSSQLRTALELVAMGIGVTVVPAMCAAAARGSGCVMVPMQGATATREVAVAWRKGRTRSEAGRTLARELADVVKTGVKRRLEVSRGRP